MNKKSYFSIVVISTTMLGAVALSSCSKHDDYYYSEERVEQVVNEKYAVAFEKAFGKVDSNVDWGFSSRNANARTQTLTRSVGTYASFRGDIRPTITFPVDCDASNFTPDLTGIPS